jgi:hypothetical protein
MGKDTELRERQKQMIEFKHSEACEKKSLEIEKHNAQFIRSFPHYCRTCGGAGWFHDAGDFYQPPQDDACESCMDLGLCPLCSQETMTETGDFCSACGWTGKREFDCLWEDECYCY